MVYYKQYDKLYWFFFPRGGGGGGGGGGARAQFLIPEYFVVVREEVLYSHPL